MITLFKADDGKIFEDEDECLSYERMLQYKDEDASIIFADEDGKIFFLSDIIKNYEFAEKIFYIYVKNFEGWNAGYEIFREFGYEFPGWQNDWGNSSWHCWYWNDKEWIDFNKTYTELTEKNKIFNRMMAEID